MKISVLAALLCACAPARATPSPPMKLSPVSSLCVTKGSASLGTRVDAPTLRAFALGTSGDGAALSFTFRGDSPSTRALASGQDRRQLGLKLRAANGCNLVYVMWRLDPSPRLEVSLKLNPGMSTHAECGANGYHKVKPASSAAPPVLEPGASHTLRAEIRGDELTAWVDDAVAWRGSLPASARALQGPAGLRSDNLSFDLISLAASPLPSPSSATCKREETD